MGASQGRTGGLIKQRAH